MVEVVTTDVKTKDILYKPKWWRGDSWKFHAVMIFIGIVISTSFLVLLSVLYPVVWGADMQIVYNSANIALNWTALAYALYIYKIYDDTKTKAEQKIREGGLEAISLEEGLSKIVTQIKKFDDWFKRNEENFKRIEEKVKGLDIGQMLSTLDEIAQMAKMFQEKGYTKDRIEKILETLSKIDLDKVNHLIDEWIESEEISRQYEELYKKKHLPKEQDTGQQLPKSGVLPLKKEVRSPVRVEDETAK